MFGRLINQLVREELAAQTELYSKLNDRFMKTERSADQYRREAMETQIQMAHSLDELRDVRATYEQVRTGVDGSLHSFFSVIVCLT